MGSEADAAHQREAAKSAGHAFSVRYDTSQKRSDALAVPATDMTRQGVAEAPMDGWYPSSILRLRTISVAKRFIRAMTHSCIAWLLSETPPGWTRQSVVITRVMGLGHRLTSRLLREAANATEGFD